VPDYRARTTTSLIGIWGNAITEVVYFGAVNGPDGQPLNGSTSYVMHFPANDLPEAVVDGCQR
jgi:hypothetical protein